MTAPPPDLAVPSPGLADVRDRYIAQVVSGRSFVDVGGLYEIVKERVSVAHAHGAAELALIDIAPAGAAIWDDMRRHLAAKRIEQCRLISADVLQLRSERFDVVYSSGIFYHTPSPLHYLDALRRMAREHVVLASTIVPERIPGPVDIIHPPGSMLYLPGVAPDRRAQVAAFFAQCGRPDIFAGGADPLHDHFGVYWLPTVGALVAMCRDVGLEVLDHQPIENDRTLGYALLLRVPQPPRAARAEAPAHKAPDADPASAVRRIPSPREEAVPERLQRWQRRVDEVLRETGEFDDPRVSVHARRYAVSAAELAMIDGERHVAFEIGLTKLFPILLTSDLGYRRVLGTQFDPAHPDRRERQVEYSEFGSRVGVTAFNVDLERDHIPVPDASIDLVLCCEVLEHMEIDPMFMLAEINRITRPGGHLFLTTPNIASARAVWKVLNGYAPHFFMQYTKDGSHHRHNYEHDIHSLTALTRAAGFETRVLKTVDVFEAPEPRGRHALDRLGMPTEFRGDDIVYVGRKTGSVTDRWPASVYSDQSMPTARS